MDSIKQIKDILEKTLDSKRLAHTYRVAETAKKLAKLHGGDIQKAEIAALLHDSYRSKSSEEVYNLVLELGLDEKYLNNKMLAHSKIAAAKMGEVFNIVDPDIKNAVAYHTTGRAQMSLIEKIVFLADAIEPGRDYKNVDHIREIALNDLDRACLYTLEDTVLYLRKKDTTADIDTLKAIEWMKDSFKAKKKGEEV